MYLTVHDIKTNEYRAFSVIDAPTRLFLTEETRANPHRFVYTISPTPLDNMREIAWADFIPILFFDLAFEPISDELWSWIDALTS